MLRTDDERSQRDRRAQRIAFSLAGLAALLFLTAGAFMQWGVSRELSAEIASRRGGILFLVVEVVGTWQKKSREQKPLRRHPPWS